MSGREENGYGASSAAGVSAGVEALTIPAKAETPGQVHTGQSRKGSLRRSFLSKARVGLKRADSKKSSQSGTDGSQKLQIPSLASANKHDSGRSILHSLSCLGGGHTTSRDSSPATRSALPDQLETGRTLGSRSKLDGLALSPRGSPDARITPPTTLLAPGSSPCLRRMLDTDSPRLPGSRSPRPDRSPKLVAIPRKTASNCRNFYLDKEHHLPVDSGEMSTDYDSQDTTWQTPAVKPQSTRAKARKAHRSKRTTDSLASVASSASRGIDSSAASPPRCGMEDINHQLNAIELLFDGPKVTVKVADVTETKTKRKGLQDEDLTMGGGIYSVSSTSSSSSSSSSTKASPTLSRVGSNRRKQPEDIPSSDSGSHEEQESEEEEEKDPEDPEGVCEDCRLIDPRRIKDTRPATVQYRLLDTAVCLYLWEDHLLTSHNHITSMKDALARLALIKDDLVMGHVLDHVTTLSTGQSRTERQLLHLANVCNAQRASGVTQQHVRATVLSAQGYLDQAAKVWAEIVQDHPLNILAVKFLHDAYIRLGMYSDMKAMTTRLLLHWKPVMPFYGQVLNLHAFSLCENGHCDEAEKYALKSREFEVNSLKAIHSLAHVYYLRKQYRQGLDLMTRTQGQWKNSERLACHFYWHWALFCIKLDDYKGALILYESHIKSRAMKLYPSNIFPLIDGISILYRITMQGVNLQNQCLEIYNVLVKHIGDHVWIMNDLHILMSAVGTNDPACVRSFKQGILQYVQSGQGSNHAVTKDVGLTLCEAMVSFDHKNHERVVDLLYPIRGQIFKIGGSQAQRDVIHELLIQSASRSRMPAHHKLVRQLQEERRIP